MIFELIILLASLGLIALKGIPGLLYTLLITVISYFLGLAAPKKKAAGTLGILICLLPLLYLRVNGIIGTLPVISVAGISYFSLQITAYLADVKNLKRPPQKNFIRFALFVCYYPHLLVGPIYKEENLDEALKSRSFSLDGAANGLIRALWGLFKMLVISARIAVTVNTIAADTESFRGLFVLYALLMYSLELYSDFSGGIDLVLGITGMLGFSLPDNFDRPYFSQSVAEFWRRWHMTLGSFLRTYVYIPLGGNRKGRLRKYINTLITFLVSGLWHGSEYLLWGLFNGIFVCIGDGLKTKNRLINRIGTFVAVSFLWCFFIWSSTGQALGMVASLFTDFNVQAFIDGIGLLGLGTGEYILLAVAVIILWLSDLKKDSLREKVIGLSPAKKTAIICALILAVMLLGVYGMGFNAQAFIYNRF